MRFGVIYFMFLSLTGAFVRPLIRSSLHIQSRFKHNKMSQFADTGKLERLCKVTKRACDHMAPMVVAFYQSITGETAKLKSDASVFTIADGIVQHLLINFLFAGNKFKSVIGEEDESHVNISTLPYKVDDLTVPEEYTELINGVREAVTALNAEISAELYQDLTIFIDPIDGTREFSTGLGEQCSFCIGFNDASGQPVAGVVYRPITSPPTYAAGAKSENYVESRLDMATAPCANGLLTSNGAISPFIANLITQLGYVRVPSGGAGNKMLMLLEHKGAAYIQDRGVSRWDTSAAQAVIEANGGILTKLTKFIADKTLESYTYLQSTTNLDFEEGASFLTAYNTVNKSLVKKGDAPKIGRLEDFKAYSNIVGLLALNKDGLANLDNIFTSIQAVKSTAEPAYD